MDGAKNNGAWRNSANPDSINGETVYDRSLGYLRPDNDLGRAGRRFHLDISRAWNG